MVLPSHTIVSLKSAKTDVAETNVAKLRLSAHSTGVRSQNGYDLRFDDIWGASPSKLLTKNNDLLTTLKKLNEDFELLSTHVAKIHKKLVYPRRILPELPPQPNV